MTSTPTAEDATSITQVLTHSTVNGLCYAAAQGINFLIQLWLVQVLGHADFGSIGVAQMCVLALIFIAELGMPTYFIREASIRTNWRAQWRRACLVRGAVIALATAALLLFWRQHYHGAGLGLGYILAALPAMLLSALNVTPLLIAQQRSRTAAAGLLVLWLVYGVAAVGLVVLLPRHLVDYGLGAAFSLGYLAFTLFLWRRVAWHTASDPTPIPQDMVKRSLVVWLPALLGTCYSVLLPFMVQHYLPGLLVYFLLANQIIQGVSGINLQLQRVLLSALAGRRAAHERSMVGELFILGGRLAPALMFALLGIFLIIAVRHGALASDARYGCLIMAEWVMGILASFLITTLMARHREYFICRITVASYLVSLVLQFALFTAGADVLVLLMVRVATTALQVALFYRAMGGSLPKTPLWGIPCMLLLAWVHQAYPAAAHLAPLYILASGVLLGLALRQYIRLIRQA